MLEAPGIDLDSNQSLKTGGKKTEKEYEVQLVLMDDFISCISGGGWSTVRQKHLWPSYVKVQVAVVDDPDVGHYLFLLGFHVITLPLAISASSFFNSLLFGSDTIQMSNKATEGKEDCKSLRLCESSCLESVNYTCYEL